MPASPDAHSALPSPASSQLSPRGPACVRSTGRKAAALSNLLHNEGIAGNAAHSPDVSEAPNVHPLVPPDIRLLPPLRSEVHTSELQSLMRCSYAVFCLIKNNTS